MKAVQAQSRENRAKARGSQKVSTPTPQGAGLAASLLSLQQSHGNQYVLQLIRSRRLQARLTIGAPGDQYEQEADRVADTVMRMPEPRGLTGVVGQVQGLQCQPAGLADAEAAVAPAPTASLNGALGSGQPLPESVRAFFEPRFGHDFGGVRVHTDGHAADSARSISARAYTSGRDIVFGAGQYAPEAPAGRHLLAHELTHVVQQAANGGALPRVQRDTDRDVAGPCDQTHIDDLIEPAFAEAREWRRTTAAWLEAHLDHIRSRARGSRDGHVRVGQRVFDELMLLERHFRISSVLRVSLPYSPDDRVSVTDLERFGNASYWVRRRFRDVELALSYKCQVNCPRGRSGSDTLGSAVAGSREATFYTNCFDRQHEIARAGVALHEAFHASFTEFNHDTYSFQGSYPGDDPMTNAESFATFAAIVATGSNYRIIILPEMTIRGGS
jgi:hypothetical protein